ncbi:MAG: sulfate/thiosulfate transport system permease protein [Acidobacteriota bacterium]|jgi:sulfate transport system permease protein|nr:sulfate/thiosulfate transport system permease protein [Acidobacteriota bacterium]
MSAAISAMRHVRGFDPAKPFGLGMVILLMLPLVLLPLASIFIFGTSSGLRSFWGALTAPDAIFALKLSVVTSFYATVFNVVFGLLAAYVLSRYMFFGRTAIIVTISLPTAIPTAVAGFALLLLWGKYGMIGRFISEEHQIMFTPYAIILANIFVTFPLAFGVLMSIFETMDKSLDEASATIGATRWQTFWHVTLPSLRGAIVTGALLTFARAIGEFGSTILVSGNLAGSTQTAPLYIFAKFNEGQVEAANAVAIVLALFSFAIFSILFFARDWLEVK